MLSLRRLLAHYVWLIKRPVVGFGLSGSTELAEVSAERPGAAPKIMSRQGLCGRLTMFRVSLLKRLMFFTDIFRGLGGAHGATLGHGVLGGSYVYTEFLMNEGKSIISILPELFPFDNGFCARES